MRIPSRRLARCSLVEASFALVASFDAGPGGLGVLLLVAKLGRREVRPRPEVRVLLDEREPDDRDDDREHERPRAAAQHGEHEQAEHEREQRRASVRPEQRREQEQRDRRPVAAPKRHVEERHHEQVARGQRRQEGRGEPPEDLAPTRVVDEVLRQARQARIAEPELILEPAGRVVVAPPRERHEIDVGQAVGRDSGRREQDRPAEPRALFGGQVEPAPEEVGRDREQIVAGREDHALVRRAPAEPRLRARARRPRRTRCRPPRASRRRSARAAGRGAPTRPRPARRRAGRPSTRRRPTALRPGARRARAARARGCGARARRSARGAPRPACSSRQSPHTGPIATRVIPRFTMRTG